MTDQHPYFATFTYPYMNGPLHIGHLYTMMEWYVSAQYHKMANGKPIFTPFGFHGTGMPIYANAMKLRERDQAVIKILQESEIPEEQTSQFEDPNHWIEYFSTRAVESISKLQLADWDPKHSFVTTDRNPYYDSFVCWQFNRLKKEGKIVYANRPCVYSIKDKQPCAAHDRSCGEEAVPVQVKITINEQGLYNVINMDDTPAYYLPHDPETAHEYIKKCLTHQSGEADISANQTVYLPSSMALSRSNDLCIVATTGQWYLEYSQPEWKEKVVQYIESVLIVHDPEVKKELLIAAKDMWNWCISREYGLGTKIPWDPKFKIDSLSDSTIYWAYYTVCSLLHYDLFGDVPGELDITPDVLTDQFWDYVFCFSDAGENVLVPKNKADRCRKAFLRHTPMDLRISGKDLIHNHLVMAIFNGIVFGERFLPQEYRVGGYVKIDNQKMSKSKGNFITVEQAVNTYPRDPLLICLVEAGDGVNDANLKLKDIKNIQKSLNRTLEIINNPCNVQCKILQCNGENQIAYRNFHIYHYSAIIKECKFNLVNSYRTGRFREGLTYGWRKMLKYYEIYHDKSYPEYNRQAVDIIKYALHPILPELIPKPNDLCSDLSELDETYAIYNRLYDYMEIIDKLITKANQKVRNNAHMELTVHEGIFKFPLEVDIFKVISGFVETKHEALASLNIIIDNTPIHEKRDPFKVKPLVKLS